MTMFAYIFVLGCACALAGGSKASPPAYVEALEVAMKVANILQQNVLSMESGVPLLADPRRHYAEIVFTVFREAENLKTCMKKDYNVEYPKVLNQTAGLAFVEPRSVVDQVAKLGDLIMSKTGKIRSLIEHQCTNVHSKDCDQVIDTEVRSDPERYRDEAGTLLVVGNTASKFMELENTFSTVTKQHAAVKYVVEGQQTLKKLIEATMTMMWNLKPIFC